MTTSPVSAFRDALTEHNATSTVVETTAFTTALEDELNGPAVGAPLPFDGVSLDNTPVRIDPTPADLEAATVGVTAAELGVTSYGSLAIRADAAGTEAVSLFPETHVAVVAESELETDVADAFERFADAANEDRSSVVLATGPSATADMGGLVYGAHGPRNVHVIVLEDR